MAKILKSKSILEYSSNCEILSPWFDEWMHVWIMNSSIMWNEIFSKPIIEALEAGADGGRSLRQNELAYCYLENFLGIFQFFLFLTPFDI